MVAGNISELTPPETNSEYKSNSIMITRKKRIIYIYHIYVRMHKSTENIGEQRCILQKLLQVL